MRLSGGRRSPDPETDQPTSPRFLKKPLTSPTVELENARFSSAQPKPAGQPFSYGVETTSPAIQRRRALSERHEYFSDGRPRAVSAEPGQYGSNGNGLLYSETDLDATTETGDWLQRQKTKLINRQQSRSLSERRSNERQLLNELRGTVARIGPDTSEQQPQPIVRQQKYSNENELTHQQRMEQPLRVQVPGDDVVDTSIRTVHTRKRTGVKDKAIRQESCGKKSPLLMRHSTPAASTSLESAGQLSPLSLSSAPISSAPSSPVYATVGAPGITSVNVSVDRNFSTRSNQDEVDNLIRTLAQESHSYHQPMQSTPVRVSENGRNIG